MKKLDDRVRSLMGPSITDRLSADVSRAQQLVLAQWAIKVALLLMLWIHDECAKQPALLEAAHARDGRAGEPYVPLDDLRFAYRHQRPPDKVLIWISDAGDEIPAFAASLSALSRPVDTGRERVGYYVLFVLRHLVVYVVAGLQDPETGIHGFDPDNLAPTKLVRIWPQSLQAVHWPPPERLATADIARLTASDPGWEKSVPGA